MKHALPTHKQLLIALICFFSFCKSYAQFATAASYPFVASSKPFNYVSGGTPVSFSNYDDGYTSGIPIGFPFNFCGVTYTSVTAETNGFMTFGVWANYTYPASTSGLQYTGPCVQAGWFDAAGSSASVTPVTYITTGSAPNRVFTLEFKGWGSYPYSSSYITYQYKLYEGGPIELMYQQESGSGGFGSGAGIGIANSQTDWQSLSNTSASPVSSSTVFNNTTITGTRPASGQSYLWGLIPCTDTPKFSAVGPPRACPGRSFKVTLAGSSLISNLTFQWQYSPDGTNWYNYTGTGYNLNTVTDSITSPRWYRCKILCTNSGKSYTSPPWLVTIAPFYYCYCLNSATITTGLDIGNVTVMNNSTAQVLMTKGNPLPMLNNTTSKQVYTDYTDSVAPVTLYRDTTYRFQVAQINSGPSVTSGSVAVFLDWNRDGFYDTVTERVMQKTITSGDGTALALFTIPDSASIGITGMRVVIQNGAPVLPCGNYGEGETEDYLANISYEPCKGPVPGGTVAGDTSVCVGYDYIVTDTSYEKRKSGYSRQWQVSGDNKMWFDVAGSSNKDTLARIFTGQPLFYRNQLICSSTNDTSYSELLKVNLKAGYKCYCFSQAVGGKALDSSDIGGFSLAAVVNNDGGTHLLNARATHKRTDHTDEAPIEINADSVYRMTVFHTMTSANHADAKITVFMDFNNNNNYDLPEDLVYTGYTNVSTYTLIDNVVVKPIAIMNVPTGMRIILNNDIAPNIPSDQSCGTYTSGETEDYIIIFRKNTTGINTITGISDPGLYPNPTNGKFSIVFSSEQNVKNIDVRITNVTGQEIKKQNYELSGGKFISDIDMSGTPKGVYFVELSANGERMIRKLVVQ